MSKTKVKRPDREVISSGAETLYKQVKHAYVNAQRGSDLERVYGELQDKIAAVCEETKHLFDESPEPE